MRTYLALLLAVFASTAFGANPSFQSFNVNQFDVSGNQVSIESGALLTNLPPASSLLSGSLSTNDFISLQSTPSQQSNAERIPWLGNVSIHESDVTNKLRMYREKPIDYAGFNVMTVFQQMYTNFGVAGQELEWNYTNFPSGPVGYHELLHTNGQRSLFWYDHINMQPSNTAQFVRHVQQLVAWNPDIIWFDEFGYYADLAAQVLATNSRTIQVMFGTSVPLDAGAITRGNAWRLHGSADPVNWTVFKEYAEIVETNAWKFSGPSAFFYIGPEANSLGIVNATASGVALQAMWGNMFLMGFNETAGPIATLTNANIKAIQQDPLVMCARLALVTNGCWYYVKPMFDGSTVVGVFNTNTFTTNSTINLSALNRGGVLPSSYALTLSNYTVYDLKPTTAIITLSQSTLTNTSLTASNYALFKLLPPSTSAATNNTPGLTGGTGGEFSFLTLGLGTNQVYISQAGVSVGAINTGLALWEIHTPVSGFRTNAIDIDDNFIIRRHKGTGLLEIDGLQTAATGFMFKTNNLPLFTISGLVGVNVRPLATFTNGIASLKSNAVAPTAITFPATTVPWTNTNPYNIELFIDNFGVTGSALLINGGQVSGGVTSFMSFGLQPGEYFSQTYTIGTPTAKWKPQ